MKDYKIFLRKKDETWQQALDRFFRFREVDMKEYFSSKEYSYHFAENRAYDYHLLDKVSEQYFDDFSNQNNLNVPESLRNLLVHHGGFRIGASLLEVFSNTQENRVLFTLSDILKEYAYKDFTGKIGIGMLKSLSNYYSFFGISFPESEEFEFLFFNKAGSFGKMLFAPNNENLVLKKILPSMFNGSIEKFTLDELIAVQIDRIIINALTVREYIN